jgi:uncharacterized protein YlxW (UPF0749 family)
MNRTNIKVIGIVGFFLLTLSLFMYGCSNTRHRANTQELIDLVVEVEELKFKVNQKQIEKIQLQNQIAKMDAIIEQYHNRMDYVAKRCP